MFTIIFLLVFLNKFKGKLYRSIIQLGQMKNKIIMTVITDYVATIEKFKT